MWMIIDKRDDTYMEYNRRHQGTSAGFVSQGPPRLFARKSHAARALEWWLQGKHVTDSEGWYYVPSYYQKTETRQNDAHHYEPVEVTIQRV